MDSEEKKVLKKRKKNKSKKLKEKVKDKNIKLFVTLLIICFILIANFILLINIILKKNSSNQITWEEAYRKASKKLKEFSTKE